MSTFQIRTFYIKSYVSVFGSLKNRGPDFFIKRFQRSGANWREGYNMIFNPFTCSSRGDCLSCVALEWPIQQGWLLNVITCPIWHLEEWTLGICLCVRLLSRPFTYHEELLGGKFAYQHRQMNITHTSEHVRPAAAPHFALYPHC